MADNFVSRGEVLTLTALGTRTSGTPYREANFNGVALIDAVVTEAFTLQVNGIFELTLASVSAGDPIYIDGSNNITLTSTSNKLFGKAVTATDSAGDFHCLLMQSL